MQIYLPIAEMAVNAESIALLGAIVGIISGVFGVGGGFLTTPFLIFMGIPPAVAVGTQASQLVASSSTAVIGHWRKRNVDFKMAGVMIAGGMVGTIGGIYIFKLLNYIGQIDLAISVLYVVFLCSVGFMMLRENIGTFILHYRIKHRKNDEAPATESQPPREPSRFSKWIRNLPYKTHFKTSKLHISALLPLSVGLVGGLMVSIMGIGAGFLLVPAMIYFLRMPPLLVVGTSLLQIIVTSAVACIMHATANQTVDMVLALTLICGSVVGAQIGVRLSKYIKGTMARFILGMIISLVGLRLAVDLVIEPTSLYSIVVR